MQETFSQLGAFAETVADECNVFRQFLRVLWNQQRRWIQRGIGGILRQSGPQQVGHWRICRLFPSLQQQHSNHESKMCCTQHLSAGANNWISRRIFILKKSAWSSGIAGPSLAARGGAQICRLLS